MSLEYLLQEKATDTGIPLSQWQHSLRNTRTDFREARLQADEVALFIRVAKYPGDLCRIGRLLALRPLLHPSGKTSFAQLRETAETTTYSVENIAEAIMVLLRWLERKHRIATLELILGYIRCAAEATLMAPNAPVLSEAVGDMLEEYGFAG